MPPFLMGKVNKKVLDATLVPLREVLSSWCSTLFDGWSVPHSCTADASGSTVMFKQCPLYVGEAITGRREKFNLLLVSGHFLIFINIEYLKNEKMEYWRREIRYLSR